MSPQQSIGHYRIVSKLGEGGMGAVYRATDTKLNRDVAVKILPDSFAADPDRLARFTREAHLLASLNHPNIAQIYGVEERAIVMELVEGPTLEERIAQGLIPLAEALEIAGQIAGALEVAHEKGIIHRDLKPANIKLTGEGSVKVLDFGLAKAMSDESAVANTANSPTLTMRATVAGMIMGTAAYMSPEQAAGKPADKRADIWSFGVVLWEMLTGGGLFQGETTSLILADVLRAPIDFERLPKDTPAAIRRLLARCLERNSRNRLRDIGEARIAIQNAGDEPVATPAPAARQMSWVWPTIAAVLLISTGVILGRIWTGGAQSAPAISVRSTLDLTPAESLTNDGFGRPHQTAMAFSPDGNVLVFAGNAGQTRQLYKRALDQAEATPIPGTDGGFGPFFSPDGQWIGFCTLTELKKVSTSGGPATPIFKPGPGWRVGLNRMRGAAWGAGDRVVFADRRGLYQISAQGGNPKVLLAADSAKGIGYASPEFLPDGKTLLYTTIIGLDWDQSEISFLPEGGAPHRLLKGGASPRYVDAGYLLYMRNGALLAAPFQAGSLKVAGTPVPILDGVMQSVNATGAAVETGIGQFAVSRAGALAYVSGGVYPSAKGSWLRRDRSGVITDLNWPDSSAFPRISPDGRQTVASVPSSINRWAAASGHVALYDLERRTSVLLTDADPITPMVWSPDGRRVVFRSGTKLESIAVDGQGGRTTLVDAKEMASPMSWSRDGKFLAYLVAPEGKSQIWVKPMTGQGEPRVFLESTSPLLDPEFSPDGKWLAYSSSETGRNEIYVQAFPGPGEKHRISTEGGMNFAWSRDGRELFYLETAVSAVPAATSGATAVLNKMMAVGIETKSGFRSGAPRVLFTIDGQQQVSPTRNWDVYPDGQHFIWHRYDSVADPPVTRLHLVWNWFEELKRRVPAGK